MSGTVTLGEFTAVSIKPLQYSTDTYTFKPNVGDRIILSTIFTTGHSITRPSVKDAMSSPATSIFDANGK